jgi:toxin HigB-1
MIRSVVISKAAQKDLKKVPSYIFTAFHQWVGAIRKVGLEVVRQQPGYHDEPLKGQRKGERSIRLNRSYRAIYTIGLDEQVYFVSVEEVNKHDY